MPNNWLMKKKKEIYYQLSKEKEIQKIKNNRSNKNNSFKTRWMCKNNKNKQKFKLEKRRKSQLKKEKDKENWKLKKMPNN